MKIKGYLSPQEIQSLMSPSDFEGWRAVFVDWAMIISSMVLVAHIPNILTVIFSLSIIGGRQLGLAILVHDTTHRSLFKTKWLNDFVGRWVCGGPIWQDLPRYRSHHMKHHQFAGSEKDPDLSLVSNFPIKKASLRRKMLRDIFGVTGIKRLYALFLMDLGMLTYTVAADPKPIDQTGRKIGEMMRMGFRNMAPMIITNGIMIVILTYFGKSWLYLLWIGSYLTTFSLFLRIRSIAEHACTRMSLDPIQNTRTTLANWMARLTVAPHRVNYHLEHHLLMMVPYFNLPKVHRILRNRNAYSSAFIAKNYREVLKIATS
jgi:fatty acid desaturase